MRITISINDITKRIYAISAVRAVNASDGPKTAVLTRDNALLLRRLICDSFMHTVGELAASVTDFSPPESDDSSSDILWIDLDCWPFRAVSALNPTNMPWQQPVPSEICGEPRPVAGVCAGIYAESYISRLCNCVIVLIFSIKWC